MPAGGSRPASAFHRAISHPLTRLNRLLIGPPRHVPVTVAVDGPPYSCVQALPGGTAGKALEPFLASAPHAAAGSGWSPPAGSQVSVQVETVAAPSLTTMVSSVGPEPEPGVSVGPAEVAGPVGGPGSGVPPKRPQPTKLKPTTETTSTVSHR